MKETDSATTNEIIYTSTDYVTVKVLPKLGIASYASNFLPFGVVALGQTSLVGSTYSTTANTLYYPIGLTFDSSGNLWVSDSYNNRVLEYLSSNLITNGYASGPSLSACLLL